MPRRKKRPGYNQQSNDFPGRGRILCRICGEPVAEHRIGRCPKADDPAYFAGARTAAQGHITELQREEIE